MDEPKAIEEAAREAEVTPDQAQKVVDAVDRARRNEALDEARAAVARLPSSKEQSGFFAFPSLHRLLGR